MFTRIVFLQINKKYLRLAVIEMYKLIVSTNLIYLPSTLLSTRPVDFRMLECSECSTVAARLVC